MSKEIDSEEVYEDLPESGQADVPDDNDAEADEQESSREKSEDTEEDAEEQTPENRRKKIRNILIEIGIYAVIILLCIFFVPRYVMQRTIVDGSSMMNTLKDEENLLVEKVSYRFSDPKRFDVIVFYPYGREYDDYFIKRVIALPGETVQIKGSDIYINDEKLEENYGKDPIDYAGLAEEPLTLGKDEFFVLGDNREVSRDSRYEDVGLVERKNIEGKAILRIYPFKKFGTFD
ncbi:MAG: signal peptidase I [Lachnospiraceae bacterium]|nr:signal peptidase I [Lachnospiraceae bacterium]